MNPNLNPLRVDAMKGRCLHWMNPTPGTGIAQAIETAFDATKAILSVLNPTGSPANTHWLLLEELLLIPTVVPASATRSEFLLAIDAARSISGGSTLTGVNPNLSTTSPTPAAKATVNFGALTVGAETAGVRRTIRGQLSSAALTQFGEYRIPFDDLSNLSRGPVILRPNQIATLHLWHPGNAVTPGSYELLLRARVIDPPNL